MIGQFTDVPGTFLIIRDRMTGGMPKSFYIDVLLKGRLESVVIVALLTLVISFLSSGIEIQGRHQNDALREQC